ncbi:hypothetical protein [Shewanella nanhaiensis]|uniref:Uncharacterized protein n=1 Tax=Shewanella nanhaiensis TaxID=2864872 RepID=A0ABS7E752_9GAMM|nr:hypothetical protein [Shewanella nanhaiensis]MBW8185514.1 hypothetical protein [Shewanella nanhaiensis]
MKSITLTYLVVKLVDSLKEIKSNYFLFEGEAEVHIGQHMYQMFVDAILAFASIKHNKFNDEQEKRLVTIFPEAVVINGSKPMSFFSDDAHASDIEYKDKDIKYRINGNGIFVPYIESFFERGFIKEIIIVPVLDRDNAKLGLEFLCQLYGIEPKISFSECPFRNV